jgi:hypothetical protein
MDLPAGFPPHGPHTLQEAWQVVAGLGRLLTAMAEDQLIAARPPAFEEPDQVELARVIQLPHPSPTDRPGAERARDDPG